MGELTKKSEADQDLHDLVDRNGRIGGGMLTHYCKVDNCNDSTAIRAEIETKDALAQMMNESKENKIAVLRKMQEQEQAGATQTTVSVATIAFSMVIAGLVL